MSHKDVKSVGKIKLSSLAVSGHQKGSGRGYQMNVFIGRSNRRTKGKHFCWKIYPENCFHAFQRFSLRSIVGPMDWDERWCHVWSGRPRGIGKSNSLKIGSYTFTVRAGLGSFRSIPHPRNAFPLINQVVASQVTTRHSTASSTCPSRLRAIRREFNELLRNFLLRFITRQREEGIEGWIGYFNTLKMLALFCFLLWHFLARN